MILKKIIDKIRESLKDNQALIYNDESGTYRVKPYGGKSYQPVKRPKRIPARWQTKGKIEIIAGYDFKKKAIIPQFSNSKKTLDFQKFLNSLFKRYKNYQKIFVVVDNFKPHKTKELIRWLRIKNKLNKKQKNVLLVTLYFLWSQPKNMRAGELKVQGSKNSN
jgi:hypothetical protein